MASHCLVDRTHSLLILGIRAIFAFHKHRSNAFFLIVSYYAITAIPWIVDLLIALVERAPLMTYFGLAPELITMGTTITLFFISDNNAELFPVESRTCKKNDLLLVGICASCLLIPCLCLVFSS